LKYLIWRIEHKKDYDSSEKGVKLDKDFEEARIHAIRLAGRHLSPEVLNDRIAKQYPIQRMRWGIKTNAHLIDGLLDEKRDLEKRLLPLSQKMSGVPHVVLARGLDGPVHAPDPLTTSYADRKNDNIGGRVRVWHCHHVPVANVWFSYNHRPEGGVTLRYPHQNDFVVSPHSLKPAEAKDLTRLISPKPAENKEAKRAEESRKLREFNAQRRPDV
jgi:hypothetical protein